MKILQVPKQDLKRIFAVFFKEVVFFIFAVFFLFFDGTYFNDNIFEAQNALNVCMILAFFAMFYKANPRVRTLMIIGVILGFIGEHFFSRILHMYSYRLENVPLYVPFGHGVLYARIFRFSKASIVKKHHKAIEAFLTLLIFLIATFYLIAFFDVFGFLMTLGVFLILWIQPKHKLFFLTMYLLVVVLEIGGTAFGAWKWPEIAFGIFEFLPSNNPPSGISFFYFLLDIGCFVLYITIYNKAWRRLKNIKKLKSL